MEKEAEIKSNFKNSPAFSLIEIIIVLSLMGFVFVVAMPNFIGPSANEVAGKLGRLSADIRAAYDMSVLSGKNYRLVFHLASGDYWLEETDSKMIKLGHDKIDTDPTEEEETDRRQDFENEFEEYIDLAGEPIVDPETDKDIFPESPVLNAKDRLKLPVWTKVETIEWSKRTLGEVLIIKDMQSEHHRRKISIDEDGSKIRAFIYFFPKGYVERAIIHIYYRKGDARYDEDQEPYTMKTKPWEGVASIVSGYEELDFTSEEDL